MIFHLRILPLWYITIYRRYILTIMIYQNDIWIYHRYIGMKICQAIYLEYHIIYISVIYQSYINEKWICYVWYITAIIEYISDISQVKNYDDISVRIYINIPKQYISNIFTRKNWFNATWTKVIYHWCIANISTTYSL